MSRTVINAQDTNKAFISGNGLYRIILGQPANCFSIIWRADDVAPDGTVAFSIDGDPCDHSSFLYLSWTGMDGSRLKVLKGKLWEVDVDVTDLPEGGRFSLSCAG